MAILKLDVDFITDEVIIIKRTQNKRTQKNRPKMRKSTPQELQREREDRMYLSNWRISNKGSKGKHNRLAKINLIYGTQL